MGHIWHLKHNLMYPLKSTHAPSYRQRYQSDIQLLPLLTHQYACNSPNDVFGSCLLSRPKPFSYIFLSASVNSAPQPLMQYIEITELCHIVQLFHGWLNTLSLGFKDAYRCQSQGMTYSWISQIAHWEWVPELSLCKDLAQSYRRP